MYVIYIYIYIIIQYTIVSYVMTFYFVYRSIFAPEGDAAGFQRLNLDSEAS